MMGMAVQLITEEHIIVYPGSVIYITAAYSFYLLTLSIVNLVKFRRLNSPVLSASKALNFAGALMSVFNLENAMTSRFSTDVEFRRIMNTAVGLTVCLLEAGNGGFHYSAFSAQPEKDGGKAILHLTNAAFCGIL